MCERLAFDKVNPTNIEGIVVLTKDQELAFLGVSKSMSPKDVQENAKILEEAVKGWPYY